MEVQCIPQTNVFPLAGDSHFSRWCCPWCGRRIARARLQRGSHALRRTSTKGGSWVLLPIGSMYAIYGNIYHQYTPNVSIYSIHGSYGLYIYISYIYIYISHIYISYIYIIYLYITYIYIYIYISHIYIYHHIYIYIYQIYIYIKYIYIYKLNIKQGES